MISDTINDAILLSVPAITDIVSTDYRIRTGTGREIRLFKDYDKQIIAHAVVATGTVILCKELRKRNHNKLVTITRSIVMGIWLGVAVKNFSGR